MKNLGLSLAVASTASLAAAQGAAQKPAEKSMHSVEAEIVSTDVDGNAVTFRVDGAERSSPVGVLGRQRLREVKAGDKVLLTCKDRDGAHAEIVAIRASRAEADKAAADKKATERK